MHLNRIIALSIISIFSFEISFAQDYSAGINVDIDEINPNAVLHLVSPNGNQGLMIPKISTDQRKNMESSLTMNDFGLLVFDGEENKFYYWAGSWIDLSQSVISTDGNTVFGDGINTPITIGNVPVSSVTGLSNVATTGDFNDLINVPPGNTDDQTLDLSGNTLSIESGNSIDLSSYLDNTDSQTLALNGSNLSIDNGNTIDLSPLDTDDQTISLSGNTLSISEGNSVDLSVLSVADDQTLSLSGNDLSISEGNTIDISSINTDEQNLSLSGTILSITDGNDVDISVIQDGFQPDTDDQTLSLTGSNLSISDGNTIDLSSINTNTDNQNLSLSGTILAIDNGNNVDLSTIQDGFEANTDNQTLSLSGSNLVIERGNSLDLDAAFVTDSELSALSTDDADADPNNELLNPTSTQLNGTNLELVDAGGTITVDLSSFATRSE